MKHLIPCALVALSLAACSTPFVGRASFDGRGAVAFDGDLFAVAAEGDGVASVSAKGSNAPLYLYGWNDGALYVASVEADKRESYEPGEPLSPWAEGVFATLFSDEQLAMLMAIRAAAPHP